MTTYDVQRKLTAILCADVVGYSRLMGENEKATLRTLTDYREVFSGYVEKFHGRIVNAPGDSILAEFGSVVDAVEGAAEIQRELAELNSELLEDRRMQFRIGINMGDVLVKGEELYGDGVNIAARLESLAEPGGICVSRPVFDQVKKKLKLHFEYMGEQQVKNIAEPVRAYQVLTKPGDAAHRVRKAKGEAKKESSSEQGGKPSIAVLAFDTMSDDQEQVYLADGIVEDIITEISRFKWFDVIGRNSSFVYRGKSVDLRKVSTDLGVRYVVEGSVRKIADRIRITVQLIDATTASHIWAEKYDCLQSEIFEVQDSIIAKIAAAINPELFSAEVQTASARSSEDLNTWNYAVRGRWHATRLTEEDSKVAKEYLYKALELNPNHIEALAFLVYGYITDLFFGFSASPPESIGKAQEHLDTALSLNEKHPLVLCAQGMLRFVLGDQDQSIISLQQAIELNPNFAVAYGYLSIVSAHAGDSTLAISMGHKALELSPHDPEIIHFFIGIGTAHFVAGDYQEAVNFADKAQKARSGSQAGHRLMAASLGHLGKKELAHQEIEKMLELSPNMTLTAIKNTIKFKNSEHAEKYMEGLRLAGMPE